MSHQVQGKWISSEEFAALAPRNVFHRQLEPLTLDCSEHRNRHVLFRKTFVLTKAFERARMLITADDYYMLYVNGNFVAQGPAPSYHFQYNYNEIDLTPYLVKGKNVIAVHTLYQGLINRVWQSGDHRHGLLCDVEIDEKIILSSDESFLATLHTGYTESGTCGYQTQFLETYDCRAREAGFARPDFDDSDWASASICAYDDHTVTAQKSAMLVFEHVAPVQIKLEDNRVFLDFGATYVGYLDAVACGNAGDEIVVRCGQELNDDGSVRYALRANCVYEEKWILGTGESRLSWFDYKAFRYAELILPKGARFVDAALRARHYPFELKAALKPAYAQNEQLRRIWELCVNTQKYGVQEVIQDCMEREKGFYLGDGCYTALTHMVLTGDDSMVRKLIDDAFCARFITPTLVTCMDCSFMQEIAEYPLMLVYLVLWHYRLTGDKDYLAHNFAKVVDLLDAYRAEYEHDYLIKELNKWCVVEWPANFRHGYDVDIREGQVCHQAHVSINAYYIAAVRFANKMARELGLPQYRDESPLLDAFYKAFYDKERKVFKDGESTEHVSLVGNVFAYGLDLCPDAETKQNILAMLDEHTMASLSMFCTFPMMWGLVRDADEERILDALLHDGTWSRILREGGTTTFEGWGKDTKWNTSLFHLTMSYGALFMADVDLKRILD
ncbi:MAG: family 78 glycoside hydrolase catalytic domain [Clostridia bacterium]|nr:family 78 glycoside hydrolase catalytic domain [Clostridia bacterium]